MRLKRLDMDAAVPARADDLSQPFSIVVVGLVELHRQSGFDVARIETDHLHTLGAQPVHEPRHQRAGLNSDPEITTVPVQDLGESLGIGRCLAAPEAAALLIHNTDRGFLLRDIQAGVVGYHRSCSVGPIRLPSVRHLHQSSRATRDYPMSTDGP
nr:hypothetical protein [Microvirga sp. VF16]